MKILLLLIITQTIWAAPTLEIIEAKKSLITLIQPLLAKKNTEQKPINSKFELQGCEKHKVNWMNVLMMREEAKLVYTFRTGCDVEGTISPKFLQPFPVELKLRNLESYEKLVSQNKITASLESKPIMFLEIESGVLTGKKGDVKFDADYRVQMDPMNKEKPIEKNLGGEMRITEIYGKKVSIKEKIFVE